jgi:heme/copper-type cytochrome/quinol oxidase subunit 1
MVFGAVMPAFAGLAKWMIPMMIGAPDMALPRMNNMSFWMLVAGATLLASTLFMEGGAPAGGWTLYPPLILQTGKAFPFAIFSVHLLGVSSIMAAINIVANYLEYACSWHDINENANVCLDMVNHRFSINCHYACIRRFSDNVVNRQIFWHKLF